MDTDAKALRRAVADYRRDRARTDASRQRLHEQIRTDHAGGRKQIDIARITGFTREYIRQVTSTRD